MQIICSVRIRRAWSGERRSACCLADDAGFERGGNRERLGGRARGARLTVLYRGQGAPGVIIYNAVMGAPDQLLSASVDHLQAAYAVDVISAIVVAQVAAPAMRAAGFGTMIVTGGAFADHPIPALATVSLGKRLSGRPRRCSGPTWSRTAYGWLRSRSPDGSLPVLPLTRSVLLSATGTLSELTASGRRSFALPASSEVTKMRAEHEIAGEASNHPSGQLNHLGALDADTTDAGPERTLRYRRRAVNADHQFDAARGFLDARRSRSEQGRTNVP
jgi:hypothetical protein